ncbi:tRNA pseudouridine(38-40) synthase TruA [Aquirufa sp.]|jgi:tRNA pseudouridine38-40 synthase|uniref:tRNA pseudouridine(38-40) synthase TruA n=1 Tax=Aquirufa sp. TaxID=2676249 RepID=UPI003783C4D5
MSRYLIAFSYDGGSFHGYQIQPNATTVQSILQDKLSLLLGSPLEIVGSSRTDTGVHAHEQFAHFDLPEGKKVKENWVFRLNRMLPDSLAVQGIYQVADDFHARFAAISRTYEYRISSLKSPFNAQFAYRFSVDLDVEAMNEAAALFFKHTDYQCFSKVKTEVTTFNCTILHANWATRGDELVFTIQGNRFLRGMVRAVVGTLLEVGQGRLSKKQLQEILDSKDRCKAGRAVPAHGLHLLKVEYPSSTFDAKCAG